MNVRWMLPAAALIASLGAVATAQTATTPAKARTAVAAAPAVPVSQQPVGLVCGAGGAD